MTYKETLKALTDIPSLSGFEKLAFRRICELFGSEFDKVEIDSAGNILLHRDSATKMRKPRIMLDAHLDEIGFVVSGYKDTFLELTPSGGLDPTLFCGMEVTVHGKKPYTAVLSTRGEKKDRKIYAFTGLDSAELTSQVKLGDAVTFRCEFTDMANGRLAYHAFDDKACGAALLCAVCETPRKALAFDVTVVLSSREEISGGGAAVAAHNISPACALITDVNFAVAPGIPEGDGGKPGEGAMLSLSAVTDRKMTDMIRRLAREHDIPLTAVVESTSTGTNANCVYTAGFPCAVLSLPLAGMHSASECLSLGDVDSFIGIVKALITSASAAEEMEAW